MTRPTMGRAERRTAPTRRWQTTSPDVTSLLFLDLPRLLRLGEQTGLIGGTESEALRPGADPRHRSVIDEGESDTTTKIQPQIK